MHYSYTPTGVHSKSIEFDIEDNIVKNVQIIGGCDGNNKGMAALAEGRTAEDFAVSRYNRRIKQKCRHDASAGRCMDKLLF